MRTRPFTIYELEEVMDFLANGFDTFILFEQDFDYEQMIEIWRGFRDGLDVYSYAKPEIYWRDMYYMREKLYKEKRNEN